jgi:predicted transcriptional regulator
VEATVQTVTLGVADRKEVSRRTIEALKGRAHGAHISFATPELLFALLTTKRREILRAMTGAGPLSIRETARRVEPDVKAVHGDLMALLGAGLLRKTEAGQVELPFDAIKVDVTLRAG